ncbi:MAG: hypothetical protein H7343_11035 [Undibacterium sp.]|nr:hypothetical protein [Opitutaceae bacterium]
MSILTAHYKLPGEIVAQTLEEIAFKVQTDLAATNSQAAAAARPDAAAEEVFDSVMSLDKQAVAAMRQEFSARLIERENTIKDLRGKLATAELLSAANLGVPPIHVTNFEGGNVMEVYNGLTGKARAAYFAKHEKAIWAAHSKVSDQSVS